MVTQPEAEAAYQAGDYSTAARIYAELLAKEPNSSSLLRGFALSQGLLGNHTEALESARKAAKIQPADPEVRYTLGYLLGLSGDHRAAVSELDTTLILKTNHVPAKLALVASLVMDGEASEADDKEHAEQVLNRAYKMDQRNPATANAYLQFLHRTGQRGKVVRELSSLDESIKSLPPLVTFVGKVKMDPQYQAIGGPASSTPISSVPIQPQVAMPPMGASPQLFAAGSTAAPSQVRRSRPHGHNRYRPAPLATSTPATKRLRRWQRCHARAAVSPSWPTPPSAPTATSKTAPSAPSPAAKTARTTCGKKLRSTSSASSGALPPFGTSSPGRK